MMANLCRRAGGSIEIASNTDTASLPSSKVLNESASGDGQCRAADWAPGGRLCCVSHRAKIRAAAREHTTDAGNEVF